MGRRSQFTPEELRELILTATRSIVEERGFRAISAREIAKEIGYAPGTLYNMYENLDEILLRVEARVLRELDDHIGRAMNGRKQHDLLRAFAQAYVDFAYDHPRTWELVQLHQPALERPAPDWYLESAYAPMTRLEPIVGRAIEDSDADDVCRNARHLWSIIHGVVHVATTAKFGQIPRASAIQALERVIGDYLRTPFRAPSSNRNGQRRNGVAKREGRAS